MRFSDTQRHRWVTDRWRPTLGFSRGWRLRGPSCVAGGGKDGRTRVRGCQTAERPRLFGPGAPADTGRAIGSGEHCGGIRQGSWQGRMPVLQDSPGFGSGSGKPPSRGNHGEAVDGGRSGSVHGGRSIRALPDWSADCVSGEGTRLALLLLTSSPPHLLTPSHALYIQSHNVFDLHGFVGEKRLAVAGPDQRSVVGVLRFDQVVQRLAGGKDLSSVLGTVEL